MDWLTIAINQGGAAGMLVAVSFAMWRALRWAANFVEHTVWPAVNRWLEEHNTTLREIADSVKSLTTELTTQRAQIQVLQSQLDSLQCKKEEHERHREGYHQTDTFRVGRSE